MKRLVKFHFSPKAFTVLLLMVLFSTQSVTYYWATDKEANALELCDPVDGESEKEESKKEKDDKIPVDQSIITVVASIASVRFLPPIEFQPLTHTEITTPPPEPII